MLNDVAHFTVIKRDMARCYKKVGHLGSMAIGHVFVHSCLFVIFQDQPISFQYSGLSVKQPIRFRLRVVYASLGISNTEEDNSNVIKTHHRLIDLLMTASGLIVLNVMTVL